MHRFFLRALAGSALLACAAQARAQASGTLPEVTVTGNPLGSADLIAPAPRSRVRILTPAALRALVEPRPRGLEEPRATYRTARRIQSLMG